MRKQITKSKNDNYGLYIGPFILLLQCTSGIANATTIFWELVAFVKEEKKQYSDIPSTSLVSKYISGNITHTKEIPFNYSDSHDRPYINDFDQRIRKNYEKELKAFNKILCNIMKTDNKIEMRELVRRLYKLIELDADISDNDEFYINEDGTYITKKELIKERNIKLQPFLLGIFHFILLKKPNDGKKCECSFKSIAEKKNRNSKYKYNGSLDNNLKFNIEIIDKFKDSNNKSINTNNNSTLGYSNKSDLNSDSNFDSLPNETSQNSANHKFDYIEKYKKVSLKEDFITATLFNENKTAHLEDFYVQNSIHDLQQPPQEINIKGHKINLDNIKENATSEYFDKLSIIIGNEGIGKTSFLRHLSFLDFQSNNRVPFFVYLKDYREKMFELKITDIIYDIISLYSENFSLEDLSNNYDVVIYFDGLDELYTTDGRIKSDFISKLTRFIKQYPNIKIIISSRPDYHQISFEELPNVHKYQINGFDEDKAKELVNKIIKINPEYLVSIKSKFPSHKDKYIEIPGQGNLITTNVYDCIDVFLNANSEFIISPLYLSIVTLIYGESNNINPKNYKFELYDKHLEIIYRKNKEKNVLKNLPKLDAIRKIISELAYIMLHDSTYRISKNELFDIIGKMRINEIVNLDTEDLVQLICEDLSILIYRKGEYSFIHEDFKYYYCSYYFAKVCPEALSDLEQDGSYKVMRIPLGELFDIFEYIHAINPNALPQNLFIPYFKKKLNNSYNNCTYRLFLKNFINCVVLCDGVINYEKFLLDIENTIDRIFELFINIVVGDTVECIFNYGIPDYEHWKEHYIFNFYEVEKKDVDDYFIGIYADPYQDGIVDECMVGDSRVIENEPVGHAIFINDICSIDKDEFPETYDTIFNNQDFPYFVQFKTFIEYLKKYNY